MIKVSKTYEVITEESAEYGEEMGFEWEDVSYSFRELIDEMENYEEASCSPLYGNDFWVTHYGTQDDWTRDDYATGNYTNYSLHYAHGQPERNRKYWVKAWEYVERIRKWREQQYRNQYRRQA